MLSFWEKQSLLKYDVIVVGSGIVGLSTAISLKEKWPAKSILVLERAILPTGASTKNAGFACIGSLTEIIDDLQHMSETEVLTLVELRLKGLQRLRGRLGEQNIGYAENGSWELIRNTSDELSAVNRVEEINGKLKSVLGKNAFEVFSYKSVAQNFGFNGNGLEYMVKNTCEGELNTGMMMRSLINMAIAKGVEIKTGCEVSTIEDDAAAVKVTVSQATTGETITFQSQQVAICTNAFSRQFYPELDIQPGRGQVLVTKPIAGLKFKGIYHFDKGYYYFRLLGDRILFGGGRNLDFEGERTTEFSNTNLIQADLTEKLSSLIIPSIPFEIEDWWAGIMAFGATKFPILMRQSERIYLGVRLGGMGVAIGSELGARLAEMMEE